MAIKTNQDGTVVKKMGYILGQDSEESVAIELSRIHLTDGEMIMPLPDPPVKPEKKQTSRSQVGLPRSSDSLEGGAEHRPTKHELSD